MAGKRQKQKKNLFAGEKKAKIKCDICSKQFNSISSLNSHKKTKHEGRSWLCPVCQKTLASKYAYIRHTKREHRTKKINVVASHAQEHEVYVKDDVAEMSEAAKTALIVKLRKRVEKKDEVIALLRSNLKKYIEKSKKKNAEKKNENENSSGAEEEDLYAEYESDNDGDSKDAGERFLGFDSNEITSENNAIIPV